MKTCLQCSAAFEINKEDLIFYEKISPIFHGVKYQIPEPKLCPQCRQQRRLAFRNERNLYYRKCDATGKQVLSVYEQDSPFPAYERSEWIKDFWSPLNFGRDFDFSRSFFEQFYDLMKVVPRITLQVLGNENCDYVNQCGYSKNCYLSFHCDFSEDVFYSKAALYSKNCIDCSWAYQSELCYESIDIENCSRSSYLQFCNNCHDSFMLFDCQSCEHCFACVGLQHKKYHIFNEAYSKEEYEKRVKEFNTGSRKYFQHAYQKFLQLKLSLPHKYIQGRSNENVTGDQISHSKNSYSCFGCNEIEDCKYCYDLIKSKDCYDWDYTGYNSELCYECMGSGINMIRSCFSTQIWGNTENIYYCDLSKDIKNCFGCIGLQQKQYCILNKQYTKEKYEALVPQIIEHMKKRGEWGEFFPISFSPFSYNETLSQEYYPLKKEEVLSKNWKWKEIKTDQQYLGPNAEIPDTIQSVDESICKQILRCEVTGKLYKIIPQELAFYKKMNLPLPKRCPDQRHKDRLALRNPRKLWNRNCGSCGKDIQTSYAPNRLEKVFCEECYLKTLY